MNAETPRIVSASFRYSTDIVPGPYLRLLGFSPSDGGRRPFEWSDYSLHKGFTVNQRDFMVDSFVTWAAMVAVCAPEQGFLKYDPYKELGSDANLHGFSLQFEQMPGVLTLRELENTLNADGLLGKVVAVRTGDKRVAIVSPSLIDMLNQTDFPLDAGNQVLESYGLRTNDIPVLKKSILH